MSPLRGEDGRPAFPVATGPIDDKRNVPKHPKFGQPDTDLEDMTARLEAQVEKAEQATERVVNAMSEIPHATVLRLRPGDHIVITVDDEPTEDACRRLKQAAEERFPGHEVTVIRANGVFVMRPETEAA